MIFSSTSVVWGYALSVQRLSWTKPFEGRSPWEVPVEFGILGDLCDVTPAELE